MAILAGMIADDSTASHWNVVSLVLPGCTGRALQLLSGLGSFRTTRYPRVLVGTVGERGRFLQRLSVLEAGAAGNAQLGSDGAASDRPGVEGAGGASRRSGFVALDEVVSRIIPLERSIPFVRDDVTETICGELESQSGRIGGASFFVRARLRGMKGRLEHPVVERAVGGFLYERARAAGEPARVCFKDPDVVVVIEVVADRVGYAFLDRKDRSHPLVKVR